MIFIKEVLQNGAKSGPLESDLTLGLATLTPPGTKHVERRPQDTKISKKMNSKLKKIMKKRSQEIIFQSKSDQPEQPDPPNQTDPHYTKRRTPILQFANPGPAECAKRLNNKKRSLLES